MEFLVSYWYVIVGILAVIIAAGIGIYHFVNLTSDDQIKKVKEWLLYAVTLAEKELGSETGQVKLRFVYDMFIAKFPYLVKVISFERFSQLVDEVLEQFEEMLSKNEKLQEYVSSKEGEA